MATNQTIFSDLSADPTQFKADLENALSSSGAWKGNLTTQVGTALIDSVAALGAFLQHQINNSYENCFQETAVSETAIRSIAMMQGLRMTRRLPASMQVSLSSQTDIILPPFTQFLCAGYSFFNRESITLSKDEAITATLYQGQVQYRQLKGLGTELQVWISDDDNFTVSDQDVYVFLNGTAQTKAYGSLWNYKGVSGYADLTTMEGRLLIQFGNKQFGTMPGINDTVTIVFCITEGETGNNYVTTDAKVSVQGYGSVTGTALENPSGGANQKSAVAYKNNTASSFGTYGSAVTKAQYKAVVNTYPGIIDAFTQSQRERNPGDVKLMNLITVTGITTTPWDDQQKLDFCNWCQDQSMYSTRFNWIDAIPVPRDVIAHIYCYDDSVLSAVKQNVENAIKNFFEARPGILMTDFFKSDLITVIRNADSGVAYLDLDAPLDNMIVTQPVSPDLTYTIETSGGTLAPYFYSYGITYTQADGTESKLNSWCHPQVSVANSKIILSWRAQPSAVKYNIFGRTSENLGLLTSVDAKSITYDASTQIMSFTDDGSLTPDPSKYVQYHMPEIKYNTLGNLEISVEYASRQHRITTMTAQ